MAAERAQNLQDTFLNHVRKNKTPLTIFLVNGVKLQGVVTWFDNFCVLLRRDGHSQLVYKHAISTIMPAQPLDLFRAEPPRGRREHEPPPRLLGRKGKKREQVAARPVDVLDDPDTGPLAGERVERLHPGGEEAAAGDKT